MRRVLLTVGAALALAALVGYAVWPVEYARVETQDGRFVAVATTARFRYWIPMMPGSGGDKPGAVTVYTRSGRSCGRAPVPMVSFLHEVQEDRPGTLTIPLVAEWDLRRCTVEVDERDGRAG